MKIDSMVVGPLGVNCYFIIKDKKVIIVDAGGNADDIAEYVKKNGLKPVAIVNTHGHFDHIGGIAELKSRFNIPFYIHKDDEFLLANGAKSTAAFGLGTMENPVADEYIAGDQVLDIEGIELQIRHTPGHTPGGVCIYVEEANALITGDTLFLESIGRSDFPYASHEKLIDSIATEILTLDDVVKVYPGHGPASSVGHERKFNPFL